tara:strand:- start:542 stop:1558 length:1017 start_codon:yes stop_codon:yes gene_type:complete
MRIKNIEYDKYKIQLKNVFKNHNREYSLREGFIIKIMSQPFVGKGEVAPLDGFSKENFQEIIWTLEAFIKSIELSTEYTFNELLNLAEIHCFEIPSLHFAIDTALYDIEGQTRNLSISKILNPQCKNEINLSNLYTVNEKIKNIKSNYIKYKLGVNDFYHDIKILNSINEHNQSIKLRLDANQAYTLEEFQNIYKQLSHLNIEYFEEPIKKPDKYKLEKIKDINIAIDESIYMNNDYCQWIEMGLINTVIIKPSIWGGFKKFNSLIKQCEQHNVNIVLSSALENSIGNMATIQLAAALDNQISHGLNIHYFYDYFISQPIYKNNQSNINLDHINGLGI